MQIDHSHLSEQEVVRREKLEKLKASGVHPYPERYETTHGLDSARELADGTAGVRVAGRITAIRRMGN